MDEAREMAGISVPFAAGTAAGIWCAGRAWCGIGPINIMAAAALLTAASMLCIASRTGRKEAFPPLFLAAGFYGALLSTAAAGTGIISLGAAEKAGDALRRIIASIPYRNEDSAALVKALLTGDRSSLSRGTVSIFRDSGASHILALSGLHLGFIYILVNRMLAPMGNSIPARRCRCACIIAAAGFYTLMTGAGPSIVRAFLFICIRELSKLDSQRIQSPARTLMLCLTVQLAISPQVITSLGFQLSYLAMCGIMTLLPVMQSWYPEPESRFGRLDPIRFIWNSAALSISCQAFTAPLTWLTFHTFPSHFLITNIIAMPLTAAIMPVTILTITLCAAGMCPDILIQADERLLGMLTGVLEIICSM